MSKSSDEFDEWNEQKKYLNGRSLPADFFYLEQEIWWAALGVNIGFEIDGKNDNRERPVLVLKKLSDELLWIVPISSTPKSGNYFYQIMHNDRSQTILLLQFRTISSRRLLRFIFRLDDVEFAIILKKVIDLFPKKTIPPNKGESRSIGTGT